MLTLLCLQHQLHEGPGTLGNWACSKGIHLQVHPLWIKPLAEVKDGAHDGVIILGGTMNIDEEENYPWMLQEKRWIKALLQKGTPILGICLGAQLLAEALGAKVYPMEKEEKGWGAITLTDEGKTLPILRSFPPKVMVYHFHRWTFDLPEGALHLARSEACPHQIFLKERVLAIQCHFEVTPTMICHWEEKPQASQEDEQWTAQLQKPWFDLLTTFFFPPI